MINKKTVIIIDVVPGKYSHGNNLIPCLDKTLHGKFGEKFYEVTLKGTSLINCQENNSDGIEITCDSDIVDAVRKAAEEIIKKL